MHMELQSILTQNTRITGGGVGASPTGTTKFQFRSCALLKNTVLSGAAIGITMIRCISNIALNSWVHKRRLRRQMDLAVASFHVTTMIPTIECRYVPVV